MNKINTEFDLLCERVHYCTLCPRMDGSARILSRAAGPLTASLMFVGEAPGRLGADSSGIPFHGDKAGHNFEELLEYAGLRRGDLFVTNAVLCNPKDQLGNNATPIGSEVRNCSTFLRTQIELVQPKIVVTLGSTALNALREIADHSLSLQRDVRTAYRWFGRMIVPLYHPGQRAMVHRSMANQRADYQFVAEQLRRIKNPRKSGAGKPKLDAMAVASALIEKLQRISYFALHKLFYLLEYESTRRLGRTLTSAFFIRQKDGPYCTDLHIQKLKKGIPRLQIQNKAGKLLLVAPSGCLFSSLDDRETLSEELLTLIHEVAARYGALNDAELKSRVYLTNPMREILKAEKEHLLNLMNAPIDFNPKGSTNRSTRESE
ncbi:MAG: uracil-DNA glycosylase [Burkholderiales bacterium]